MEVSVFKTNELRAIKAEAAKWFAVKVIATQGRCYGN